MAMVFKPGDIVVYKSDNFESLNLVKGRQYEVVGYEQIYPVIRAIDLVDSAAQITNINSIFGKGCASINQSELVHDSTPCKEKLEIGQRVMYVGELRYGNIANLTRGRHYLVAGYEHDNPVLYDIDTTPIDQKIKNNNNAFGAGFISVDRENVLLASITTRIATTLPSTTSTATNMAKIAYKAGDVVNLNKSTYITDWETTLGLYLNCPYEVIESESVSKDGSNYMLRSLDPTKPGIYNDGKLLVSACFFDYDEKYLEEKFKEIFG